MARKGPLAAFSLLGFKYACWLTSQLLGIK